jgi:hypothetical protein
LPRLPVSEQEVRDIMRSKKTIEEDIAWSSSDDKAYTVEFNVPIKIDYPCKLILIGSYNFRIERFSFTILYNNEARIRSLDIGTDHKNPDDKKKIGKKHKHKWTNKYKDKLAYVPDDITTGAKIHKVFYEFLKECNIEYKGEPFQLEITYQMRLDDI